MNIPELIQILQAAEAGKVIEYRHSDCCWVAVPHEDAVARIGCVMHSRCGAVRVKPEPREWWVSVDARGVPGIPWDSRNAALNHCSQGQKPIHVREVLP